MGMSTRCAVRERELRARRARHILTADRQKNYLSRISDWIYGF